MKKFKNPGRGGKFLVLVFFLGLAGFRSYGSGDEVIDRRLTGVWSNRLEKRAGKTLVMDMENLSFTASLDPGVGRGIIDGRVVIENGEYVLQNMTETSGRFWGFAVKSFNNVPVQIFFYDDDRFELSCEKNKMVETFFGGTFYRHQESSGE
ncbi:MAG: hypothetical protein LBK27_08895 [Treponema sp.]|nr:hypothetical protein [Treponema sp.]